MARARSYDFNLRGKGLGGFRVLGRFWGLGFGGLGGV